MSSHHIFKVQFVNQGKVYEVYARKVSHGSILGFVEIEELVFDARAGVKRSFLPMHSVLRIDEVSKRGASKITEYEGNVTQFPTPLYTPAGDQGRKS
jgi:hypothetical protein